MVDKRRKIPKTKILMNYFAGKAEKDNLYAHYDLDKKIDTLDTNDMKELIVDGIVKENFISFLKPRDFRVAKSGKGINIFSSHDEYEVAEELFRMDKRGLFGHTFKMPKYIKKFREP